MDPWKYLAFSLLGRPNVRRDVSSTGLVNASPILFLFTDKDPPTYDTTVKPLLLDHENPIDKCPSEPRYLSTIQRLSASRTSTRKVVELIEYMASPRVCCPPEEMTYLTPEPCLFNRTTTKSNDQQSF